MNSTAGTRRVIGGFAGFCIVAGSMLGVGIFIGPPQIAQSVASPWVFLALWLAGGLFCLGGAVACGELGAMMPEAGGDYVFQRAALGPSIAFGSGWVLFGAIFTGSIAAMSVALCQYQLPALTGWDTSRVVATLPLIGDLELARVIALGLVLLFTIVNVSGARVAGGVQAAMTLVPLVVLAVLAIAGIVRGGGAAAATPSGPAPRLTLNALVLAYMVVYFAYSGWINIIYVAGEVDQPARNIPRSLILGTLAVVVLYMLLGGAFVATLGMPGLAGAGEAGSAMAGRVAGEAGGTLMALLILSALIASINGTVLGGARVAYAMARDGAFWSQAGTLHPRTGAPSRALWLQGAWSAALICSGRFDELLHLVSLAMIITGSLTVASVFVLRRKEPERGRPYRATLYPWLPGLYLVSGVIAFLVTVGQAIWPDDSGRDPLYPLLGALILIVGFTAHALLSQQRGGDRSS